MRLWAIERARASKRGAIEAGTQPVMEWAEDKAMGRHRSRADAVRYLMVGLDPALAFASDAFVSRHYQQHVRNVRTYRVVRLPLGEVTP